MSENYDNVNENCPAPTLKNYKPDPTLKDYTVKPLFSRSVYDITVAAVLCVLSILAVSAVFWNKLSLGCTVAFDAAVILISVFLLKGNKPHFIFLTFGVLSLICATAFSVTSNVEIKVIILILTAVSAIVWFSDAAGNKCESGDYGLIIRLFKVIANTLTDIPAAMKGLFARGEKKSKNAIAFLIGIVCALPALFVIVPLLSRSDVAFSSLVSGLFDYFITAINKIVLGIILSVFVISGVFSLKYNKRGSGVKPPSVSVNKITVGTFLSVLSVVYLVYLFSQLAYFFSAFSSILPEGYKFTYAEYARRGFFELCAISAINFALLFAAILITEKKNSKIPAAVVVPSAFTVVFTIIIIFTALSKMVMYIDVYALTVLRVCTSAFMIWLFVLFIFLFVRLFIKKLDLLKTGLIVALIILSVMGIGNVNAVIAKYNYDSYVSGGKEIDVEYISKLSDEGIPYLYKLTRDEDFEIANRAKAELAGKFYEYYSSDDGNISGKKFSSLKRTDGGLLKYTCARHKAYEVLEKYAKERNGKIFIYAETE